MIPNYRLLCHLLTSICYGCAPSQHCMKDCQHNPYSIICSNSTTNAQEQSAYRTIELEALQRVGPTNCKNTTPRNKIKMICSTLDQEDKLGQYSTNGGLRMSISTNKEDICLTNYQHHTLIFQFFMTPAKCYN
jgi:hypothetical protein